jgi:hypothetical protein
MGLKMIPFMSNPCCRCVLAHGLSVRHELSVLIQSWGGLITSALSRVLANVAARVCVESGG